MRLDGTDLSILEVLQENGRLSFRQISERVKVSVPTVSNKIATMENLGIIRGYQVDLDTERLGEISVIITIKAKPAELRTVASHFENNENVRDIFILSNGRLLTICTFTDSHRINEFATQLCNIPEIMEYDIANIVTVIEEKHRALVAPGATLMPECPQCKKEIIDQAIKIKVNGKDFYLCSPECAKAFQDRQEKAKPRSSL